MAQLLSSSDGAHKRRQKSWQDTSIPPNVLIRALGPGRTSPTLQFNLDVSNQPYHRDSMKGQITVLQNLLFLFQVPPTSLLFIADASLIDFFHREPMKGQTADAQNWLLGFSPIIPVGQPRAMVINPVFNKHHIQDTAVTRNAVLDLISQNLPPFAATPSLMEDEQTYRHDSLSGQYSRSGAVVVIGTPPAFNEIYTYVHKTKVAQEPFVYPNTLVLGIAANIPPFVQRQGEDHKWRAKPAQEPFQYPNTTFILSPVTTPFIYGQREDQQWRGKKTQEPYNYPNRLIIGLTPLIVQPFVQIAGSDLHWRGHKTQEHYDFSNTTLYTLPPPIQTGFRVMAVTDGWYGNVYRTAGDVFDIAFAAEFSDASVNYQINSNTIGYGWMVQVAPSTPLFNWLEANNAPYLPPQDPNRRFIF